MTDLTVRRVFWLCYLAFCAFLVLFIVVIAAK